MNPFLRNKASTIAAVTILAVVAACYGAAFGWLAGQTAGAVVIDCLAFAATFAAECIIVWNIMKYVLQPIGNAYFNQYLLIIGFFVVVSTVGIESIVNYSIDNECFSAFAKTLPARALVLLLLFGLVVQTYCHSLLSDDESDSAELQESVEPEQTPSEPIDKITVRNGQKINVINIADICYIKADGDYVSIATESGRWLKEQTMKYYEQNLPMADFVRVHRSYIVNVGKISRIERYGQQQLVELRNGEKIKVSNSGYKALKKRLKL
ncbi:MAG: LytTR family transcriptional regulator DNA-binding domain-containing protein [Salinivirgaceae bacterium]|nr:LytTR family transcriptional regulator DNA-binding domain-containing protein [Salinivirgaceae bacterium]